MTSEQDDLRTLTWDLKQMKLPEEAKMLEACKWLRDAADTLNQAADAASAMILDPTSAKARLEKIRDELTQAHELIDAADGDLVDIEDVMKACSHGSSEKDWKAQNGFWTCIVCGDVWTGMRWQGHLDDPKKD